MTGCKLLKKMNDLKFLPISKSVIWLIGNKGMLGKQIEKELVENKFSFIISDKEVDIVNLENLKGFIKNKKINWIINCAAYTAVDKAEDDSDQAFMINSNGVENIAKIAYVLDAKMIHFSTDYVYSGNSNVPYKEDDKTNPQSIYGKSKLEGENHLINKMKKFFIFRISWLYGIYGPNFVRTMIRLFGEKDNVKVVCDQIGAPTYTGQLAKNIIHLIQNNSDKYGIYHYSDEGEISWYDLAIKIKEMLHKKNFVFKNSDLKIQSVSTNEYPTKAKRPGNSLLDKTKIRKILNFKIKNWEENLYQFFNEWEKNV